MLTATKYPTKMFQYITSDALTQLGTPFTVLHYEHGHPKDIVKTLQAMSADPLSQSLKFPMVALFQDFDEKRGDKATLYDASFHLVIATLTEKNYMAAERMTNTFIPTLYPIYDQILKSIAKSGYFMQSTPNLISHTKTDRMYWGKSGLYGNEGNVFDDFIDAIEVTNLQLTIKIKTC